MKRLLNIFLILTVCIMSVLPVMPTAYAAESAGNDLISYLTDGITFSADGVTRAEFAAGLIRLAYEKVPGTSSASFSDVTLAHTYAPEIYTALSKGLISPGEKFNPDEKITYAQAMKMAVSMLGYGTLAQSTGGYPAGYFSYGQRAGVSIKDKGSNDFLTSSEAVLLLSKVAEADMLAVSELGTYMQIKNSTILSDVRGIFKTSGVITANTYSSLYSADGAVKKGFVLGTESFSGTVPGGLLGYHVVVYYQENDNGDKEACVVTPRNNEVVTLLGRECDPIRGNTLTDVEGDDYKIDPAYNLIYNGKAYSKNDGKKFLNGADVKLTLVDAGEDGVFETIFVEEAAYMKVSRIENGIGGMALYDNETKNSMVSLFGEVEYEIYADGENGLTEISFDNISIGSLVASYSSEDKKLVKLVLCNKRVTGAVTSLSKTEKTVTIGEEKYYVNDTLDSIWGSIALGVEQEYLLDESGRITAIGVASSAAQYGWIVAAKNGSNSGISTKILLKIFTQSGEMEILPLADRVLIDGVSTPLNSLSEDTFNNLTDDMRLVRFKKNTAEEPKVIMIDYPTTATPGSYVYMEKSENTDDALIRNRGFETLKFEGTTVGRYDSSDGRTFGYYHLDGGCTMFCIPAQSSRRDDDKNYVIGTDGIQGGYQYSFAAYDMDVYAVPGAVVALTNSLPTAVNDKTTFGIVESVETTVNEDNEQIPIVYLAVQGKIVPYYLDKEIVSVASTLSPGDCIRFNSFKKGYINAVLKDYDFSDNQAIKNSPRGAAYGHLDAGWIYSINNRHINLMPEGKTTGLSSNDIIALNYAGQVTYVYVKPATESKPAKINICFEPQQEVRDYVTSGQQADRAVVYGAYNNITNVVIYRFN